MLCKLCKNNDHPWLFHCNNMSVGACSSQFAVGIVSYARTTIIHGYFISFQIAFARSLGRYLNTRLSGLVFKQLPRDLANVNA